MEGDYRSWADDNLALFVMIETVAGVKNAEAILSVEGVTGCFIGPNDLALSMGIGLGEIGPGTAHEAAMLDVVAAAGRTGKAAGKHCFSAAEVTRRIAQGFRFLALSSDLGLLESAARTEFAAVDQRT